MKFQYLMDRFKYCLVQSIHPKKKFKLKPCSSYFGDETAQSQIDMVTVTSDCPPSPHQTTPPLQIDVGEHAHIDVQPSHPPDISSSIFCAYLVVSPIPRHMYFLPQPPSSNLDNPPDDKVLCSSNFELYAYFE